jgi:hypothetical protein
MGVRHISDCLQQDGATQYVQPLRVAKFATMPFQPPRARLACAGKTPDVKAM